MNSFIEHAVRAVVLFLFLASCSPGPAPVSQSKHDPSNPNAPAGEDPAVAVNAGANAAGSATAPRADGGARAQFTCSMHPEVVSDQPGRCPKCGMNLVEKK